MRKYLNTLYITTDGAYLHKERETLVVEIERRKKLQLPIHTIGNIFCFGRIMVSPPFMGFCGETGVGLAFFSRNGRFLARIHGPVSGNVLLRRQQYRFSDETERTLQTAIPIIGAKIASSRTSLQRVLRNNPRLEGRNEIGKILEQLRGILRRVKEAKSLEHLRGYEGQAANHYFSVFNHFILRDKKHFFLRDRNRRPPRDRVNAMLSFLYALIYQDCISACEGVGLDPAVGFLHRDRPGRYSLALDIMEEFRPFLADRVVLSLINRGQVRAKGFRLTESGAVRMDDTTRKTVISSYQDRKKEEVIHPFLGEKAPIGLFFHLQAMLMARYIRGDLDFYPPYVWR